jgi:hypothetical protein
VVALTLALFGTTAGESDAGLRYRTAAHECFAQTEGIYVDANGLNLLNGAAGGVGVRCSIPIGPQLVDLGDGSGNLLSQVQLRFAHTGNPATVSTSIQLRDNNSWSSCTCGSTSGAATNLFTRTMTFNCGACAFGTDWSINVTAFTFGSVGTTTLKQLSVFD